MDNFQEVTVSRDKPEKAAKNKPTPAPNTTINIISTITRSTKKSVMDVAITNVAQLGKLDMKHRRATSGTDTNSRRMLARLDTIPMTRPKATRKRGK